MLKRKGLFLRLSAHSEESLILTNIILFPGVKKETQPASEEPYRKPRRLVRLMAFARGVLKFFQISMVLGWPILRWFVYLDLLLTFLRMLFHTSPQAGLVFALHCGVFLMAACLVSFCGLDASSSLKKQSKNHNLAGNKRKRCCH